MVELLRSLASVTVKETGKSPGWLKVRVTPAVSRCSIAKFPQVRDDLNRRLRAGSIEVHFLVHLSLAGSFDDRLGRHGVNRRFNGRFFRGRCRFGRRGLEVEHLIVGGEQAHLSVAHLKALRLAKPCRKVVSWVSCGSGQAAFELVSPVIVIWFSLAVKRPL